MSLAVVQHKSGVGSGNGSPPGSLTLTSTPTSGNLLIVFLYTNIAVSSLTYNSSSWTLLNKPQGLDNLGTIYGTMLGRYVQPGDTTALPNFCTAGNTYWSAAVYEISGVAGTFVADILSVTENQGSLSSPYTALKQRAMVANSLALAGYALYNGGSNPSIAGTGWTQDEAGNNFANWGSWGAASNQVSSAGDIAQPVITQTAGLTSVMTVVLTPSAPQAPYVRQQRLMSKSSGAVGAVTPWLPPKIGNLLVAFIFWGDGATASPTVGSGWNIGKTASNGSNNSVLCLYRYAQTGDDTGPLPALLTGGSAFQAIDMVEVGGVSGSWATDVFSIDAAYQASGTPLTTQQRYTIGANDLVLASFGNYDGNALLTSSSTGYDFILNSLNFSDYGQWGTLRQHFASDNSSVQSSCTINATGHSSSYVQIVFNGNPLGTQDNIKTIQILAGKVGSNLTNFPVLVDLSLMPNSFWSGLYGTDGGDIRIRNSLNQSLPIDLVWINTGTKSGVLFFKADSLLSASANVFTVHYGNSAYSALAVGDAIGRNAVWSDYHRMFAFDPSGGHADRCGSGNDLTIAGTPTYNSSNGAITLDGSTMDGYSDNCSQFTTWTYGCNVSLAGVNDNITRNALSYLQTSDTGDSTRATNGYRGSASPNRFGLWNTSDGWVQGSETVLANTYYRLVGTQNGTSDRSSFVNGVKSTDTTVIQKPGGSTPWAFVIGSGRATSVFQGMNGKMQYCYLRSGVLSDDWLAAEAANWNGTAFILFPSENPVITMPLQERGPRRVQPDTPKLGSFEYLVGAPAQVWSTKFLGYAYFDAPKDAMAVAKLMGYAFIGNPLDLVASAKFLGYTYLEPIPFNFSRVNWDWPPPKTPLSRPQFPADALNLLLYPPPPPPPPPQVHVPPDVPRFRTRPAILSALGSPLIIVGPPTSADEMIVIMIL